MKAAKRAVNDLTLAEPAQVRSDAAVFQALVTSSEARERLAHLSDRGLQTPGALERDLGSAVAEFHH